MSVFRILVTAFLLAVLVSCGGGGGGAMNINSTVASLEPLPLYPIESVSSVRTLAGGQQATSMTSMQILQNIQSRATSADILQMNLYELTTEGNVNRHRHLACSDLTCISEGSPTIELSLDGLKAYPISTTMMSDFGNVVLSAESLEGFNTESSIVMVDNGVIMVQGRGAARISHTTEHRPHRHRSYGGWLSGSVFGVEFSTSYISASTGLLPHTLFGGYSFGNDSGSNPTIGVSTWNGVMVGTTTKDLNIVHGDAMVSLDHLGIDVSFTNIINTNTRMNMPDMAWMDLRNMTDGAFIAGGVDGSYINGMFYGEGHEEVGGVFERDGIVGAFGASR